MPSDTRYTKEYIPCGFCGEDLSVAYVSHFARGTMDTCARCPRCGVAYSFTTEDASREEVAQRVCGAGEATDEMLRRMSIVILPGIDILPEQPGEESRLEVNCITAWDPDEMLTTAEVASILGVTRNRVSHLVGDGAFPGAERSEPSGDRYKRGRWLIPRRDVLARLQGRD